ncbi:MAG: hypothetical protein QNK85_01315 [Crocinitomicaceae bacterium]
MKKNIEQGIKNSLENHEMAYNASAWTAIQVKLDKIMPVQPKSNFKFYAAIFTLLAVAIASLITLDKLDDKPTEEPSEKSQNIENKKSIKSIEAGIKSNSELTILNSINVIPNKKNEKTVTDTNKKSNDTPKNQRVNDQPGDNLEQETTPILATSNNSMSSDTSNIAASKTIVLPTIEDICEGEVINVENKNDEAILIEGNSLHFIIPAYSKRTVITKSTGNHSISVLNSSDGKNSSTFFVKEGPSVDFTIDSDVKFEKGTPSTYIESVVPGQDFAWVYDGQKLNGRKVIAHFYDKGDYDITLTVTGSNGCKASLTKSMYVEQTYNLMAVNSFIPASTDNRKNTFMPYALTQRDTKFTMIIIDPLDGHIVYQTNDATAGWNGTDIATGSLVSYESAYIWKVIIETKEVNENNEYVGNIIPVDWR